MHFQKFDDFVYYPVIRTEIRNATVSDKDFTLVYLNSFRDEELMKCFTEDKLRHQKFIIYSAVAKRTTTYENCTVKPLDNESFISDMVSCSRVITAGGFQTISEALYLGKKLFVIPIKQHSEQKDNAQVLEQMGVKTSTELNAYEIKAWMDNPNTVEIKFEDDLQKIVDAILNIAHTDKKRKVA